uniref:Uncharacterized protein n=1 Tax=Pyrodinium bahamense TaxID=73915 RepID=A0A7S0B7Q8_9DINO
MAMPSNTRRWFDYRACTKNTFLHIAEQPEHRVQRSASEPRLASPDYYELDQSSWQRSVSNDERLQQPAGACSAPLSCSGSAEGPMSPPLGQGAPGQGEPRRRAAGDKGRPSKDKRDRYRRYFEALAAKAAADPAFDFGAVELPEFIAKDPWLTNKLAKRLAAGGVRVAAGPPGNGRGRAGCAHAAGQANLRGAAAAHSLGGGQQLLPVGFAGGPDMQTTPPNAARTCSQTFAPTHPQQQRQQLGPGAATTSMLQKLTTGWPTAAACSSLQEAVAAAATAAAVAAAEATASPDLDSPAVALIARYAAEAAFKAAAAWEPGEAEQPQDGAVKGAGGGDGGEKGRQQGGGRGYGSGFPCGGGSGGYGGGGGATPPWAPGGGGGAAGHQQKGTSWGACSPWAARSGNRTGPR